MKSTISCQTTSVIEDEMEERKKRWDPNGWNTMGTLSMHSENVIARMETLAGSIVGGGTLCCRPIMSCYTMMLAIAVLTAQKDTGWQRSDIYFMRR